MSGLGSSAPSCLSYEGGWIFTVIGGTYGLMPGKNV